MNKKEIANLVSRKLYISRGYTEQVLDATFEVIADAMAKGERVTIQDFGSFEAKSRAPRMGRNPRSNTPVPIPAKTVPTFKPFAKLKRQFGQK